ncbi:MAG: endopeptidase La [Candidatus Delongbacteria bacterium]|nr:endopeptidase La [Candidatus Delongbacteria bacterium]MBN2836667.1 endopeptidase La [Candidatus Delongbacteria bacterium]
MNNIFTDVKFSLDPIKVDSQKSYVVIPSKENIPFPGSIFTISFDSINLARMLEDSYNNGDEVVLLAKKFKGSSDITSSSYFTVGSIGRIIQIIKVPGLGQKALVQSIRRVSIEEFSVKSDTLFAVISPIIIREVKTPYITTSIRMIKSLFSEYYETIKSDGPDILAILNETDTILGVLDMISYHLDIDIELKQSLLEFTKLKEYLNEVHTLLINELEFSKLEKKVELEVSRKVMKDQKEYFLKEKIKGLRSELDIDGADVEEVTKIYKLIEENLLSENAEKKALAEIDKLKRIHSGSPEYGLVRDYLDLIANLPWKKSSKSKIDIASAEKILDEDHYGLEKPKERIIEYLSVLKLVDKIKGPIICLVGPPGVGKTSLGRSIARALDREYIRIALGGLHDEAEIRGHRRTYIGAMPGKIIQNIKKSGVNNPLFLLDEIDKLSSNFRGDPASALLEVLDPEQNSTFIDNYLDVEYDLSKVLFITTANDKSKIPQPLLDRMELIELDGYLDVEKYNIARKYLIPKQMMENGVSEENLTFSDEAIYSIITGYTMEAGVRELDRKIAKICRKAARLSIDEIKTDINLENLEEFLGIPTHLEKIETEGEKIGEINGLAWTSVGGSVLKVETNIIPGKGKLNLTGKLGDVMKESAQTALSYVRSISDKFGIDKDFFENCEIHIHFPEGAIPKDGPSAGITIASALLSAITKTPVKQNVGMTGEIALHGDVLPIGGLNSKLMAAKRSGIKSVILPERNKQNVMDISKDVTDSLDLHYVKHVNEVFRILFNNNLDFSQFV